MVGDVEGEVLGHFVLVEYGTDCEADFGRAAQRLALAGNGRGDARQVALSGGEQILALARALGSERTIAADNEAFAGEIGRDWTPCPAHRTATSAAHRRGST
jgi:hypothetical protein